MRFNLFQRTITLFCSSLAGLLVGGMIVTPVIAWMYYTAQDGPIFPAPLVAFVVVLPMVMFLVAVQAAALGFEWISKRPIGMAWIGFGLAGGGGSGLGMVLLLNAANLDDLKILGWVSFMGLGLALGLTVFGFQSLLDTVWNVLNQRSYPPIWSGPKQ